MNDLSHPAAIQALLTEIEADMSNRQNEYEDVTRKWYIAQREISRKRALALLAADADTVTEKKAQADLAAYEVPGASSEAEYQAVRAVMDTLSHRSMLLMALLKSQARAG